MPQFDPSTFGAQLFWLILLFGLLWLILARAGLPRVERIFQDREQRIANDLDMAEKLNADSEKVRHAYEQALAEARAASQSAFAESHAAVAAKLTAREAELDAALSKRLSEAEAAISQAQTKAMTEVEAVAMEAAEQLLGRLNMSADPAQLKSAVAERLSSKGEGA